MGIRHLSECLILSFFVAKWAKTSDSRFSRAVAVLTEWSCVRLVHAGTCLQPPPGLPSSYSPASPASTVTHPPLAQTSEVSTGALWEACKVGAGRQKWCSRQKATPLLGDE